MIPIVRILERSRYTRWCVDLMMATTSFWTLAFDSIWPTLLKSVQFINSCLQYNWGSKIYVTFTSSFSSNHKKRLSPSLSHSLSSCSFSSSPSPRVCLWTGLPDHWENWSNHKNSSPSLDAITTASHLLPFSSIDFSLPSHSCEASMFPSKAKPFHLCTRSHSPLFHDHSSNPSSLFYVNTFLYWAFFPS